MNCQEFEAQIDSLARDALADSRARAESAAHEGACPACAARLADGRAITRGLRALASGMKGEEAPARVEAALLAVFRASAARGASEDESQAAAAHAVSTASVSPASAQSVRSMPERAALRGWSWAKTLAVASLAAAAAVALFVLAPRFVPAQKQSTVAAGTQKGTQSPGNTPHDSRDNPNETATPDDRHLASQSDDDRHPSMTGPIEITTPRAASPRRSTPVRATNADYMDNGRPGASAASGEMTGGTDGAEIATDFIPLAQAAHFAPAEGGHVVRVEMPRSALVSFGLPVNFERAGGRVKADVLVGDDGIARAIRFVR
jgi:hypothetical protein